MTRLTELEAHGPNGKLRGALLAVDDPRAPVMLIIPGSGPTDRDGNSPLGIRAAPYRLLAEGLAAEGIASLRIDKRGMFSSAGAVPDPNAVTIRDYAADVHTWIATLRAKTGAPGIWLLGHSEGSLVAQVAAKDASDVCGLILVATAGRPLGEVLRTQLQANPANAPILAPALHAIDLLEAGRPFDPAELPPALLPLFRSEVQLFLIDTFAYDPAFLLAGYRKPVLILQGARDIQVERRDAERLKAAQPDAELRFIPDANHVLKVVTSEDRAANLATYADPNLPLALEIVPAIVQFLRNHPPAP